MPTWRKLIFFGDSLTQYSFQPQGFGSAIADQLQRKADVLNRGFEGYCTKNAVNLLNDLFPSGSVGPSDVVVIFFGANDSFLPGFSQHVPIQEFESNLHKLIEHFIQLLGLPASQIIVVSPPATEPEMWTKFLKDGKSGIVCNKDNDFVKLYADTCGKVASTKLCGFVNLWEEFMNSELDLGELLKDGLHFSEKGNQLVSKVLWPHLMNITNDWEKMYPDWMNA
ncbi:isoamyl acetate-hydrolyzing esterase 1 homolog [Styela clava]